MTALIETIAGTNAVGQRLANAEQNFRETVCELTGCTEAEALKVFNVMCKLKLIKLDSGVGRYNAVHGAYMEPDALRNAISYPN